MYLPSPSCVMPRETSMPVFGTSANLIVSFGCAQIASERSLPTLSARDVERGRELDVADVVAAEVHVHQPRDELVVRRVLVVLHSLQERVGAVADADDARRGRGRRGAPCRSACRFHEPSRETSYRIPAMPRKIAGLRYGARAGGAPRGPVMPRPWTNRRYRYSRSTAPRKAKMRPPAVPSSEPRDGSRR